MTETIAAVLGALIGAIISFWITQMGIRENRKIARAQLLLQFDERLDAFTRVHEALHPKGDWHVDQEEPPADIHWSRIEGYMGAFERLYVFLKDGIVDKDSVKTFYQYRLRNLVANKLIRERLTASASGWVRFHALCRHMGIEIK